MTADLFRRIYDAVHYYDTTQSLTGSDSADSAAARDKVMALVASDDSRLRELRAEDVTWVVNDNAELGVRIGAKCFFLYKGRSLVYEGEKKHDDGTPMMVRPVGKREFGECCHPVKMVVAGQTSRYDVNDPADGLHYGVEPAHLDRIGKPMPGGGWERIDALLTLPEPAAAPGAVEPVCERCKGSGYICVGSSVPGCYGFHLEPCPKCRVTFAGNAKPPAPESKAPAEGFGDAMAVAEAQRYALINIDSALRETGRDHGSHVERIRDLASERDTARTEIASLKQQLAEKTNHHEFALHALAHNIERVKSLEAEVRKLYDAKEGAEVERDMARKQLAEANLRASNYAEGLGMLSAIKADFDALRFTDGPVKCAEEILAHVKKERAEARGAVDRVLAGLASSAQRWSWSDANACSHVVLSELHAEIRRLRAAHGAV